MSRNGRLLAGALIVLAALAGVAAVLSTAHPANDHGPGGYWVAAQYFGAREGALGGGMNLLVTPPSTQQASLLRARLRRGAKVIVVVQSPAEVRVLAKGLTAVQAGASARPAWTDPSTAGVARVRLGKSAFGLRAPPGPPLLVGARQGVVLTRLLVGRGELWLVTDPDFFSNAEIGWRGHLQVLANLVRRGGGTLTFADWPAPPVRIGVPDLSRLLALALALLPGLALLLWALGARFGAVRRIRSPVALGGEDREALAWLLRRRQAGAHALRVLLDEHRQTIPATLRQKIEFRIALGKIGPRELERWRRLLAENGGTRVG